MVNVIYDDLLTNHTNTQNLITECFEKMNFSHFQMQIIETYVANYLSQVDGIKQHLKPTWTYERLNPLTLAIIHTALSEANFTGRKIIIDQALITCERRGLTQDKKFINAILDKLLPYEQKEK